MLHIVLVEPEIPPNTGNVIRLAANTGFSLHLIEPMAFKLDDAKMRRAGLDYHEFAHLQIHHTLGDFITKIQPTTVFAFSSKAQRPYTEARFSLNDALVFGPETRGLSKAQLNVVDQKNHLRLPMQSGSRSLNLSNTVAIVVYEAWRQLDFVGAKLSFEGNL